LIEKEKNKKNLEGLKELLINEQKDLEYLKQYRDKHVLKLKNVKFELEKAKGLLCSFLNNLLSKGTFFFKNGISWIIKILWQIKSDINISIFPKYLDMKSVDYLLKYSKGEIEFDHLNLQYKKLKEIFNLTKEIDSNSKQNMNHCNSESKFALKVKPKIETIYSEVKRKLKYPNFDKKKNYDEKLMEILEIERKINIKYNELRILKQNEMNRVSQLIQKGQYESSNKAKSEDILRCIFGEKDAFEMLNKVNRKLYS